MGSVTVKTQNRTSFSHNSRSEKKPSDINREVVASSNIIFKLVTLSYSLSYLCLEILV